MIHLAESFDDRFDLFVFKFLFAFNFFSGMLAGFAISLIPPGSSLDEVEYEVTDREERPEELDGSEVASVRIGG